jgi:WD40 repeat protein
MGSNGGHIHVYEILGASKELHKLKLVAMLAHHSGSIHKIVFHAGHIISCSNDMTVGVVTVYLQDGSLRLSKLLHGHVSRVRTIDAEGDKVLSGSDDRSVKLWSLNQGNMQTLERSFFK